MSRQAYHLVPENCGEIFDFPDIKNSSGDSTIDEGQSEKPTWLVGTYGVRTCVRLYVKMSDRRCLMVHMNAVNQKMLKGGIKAPENRLIDEQEGRELHGKVLQALQDAVAPYDWKPTGDDKVVWCCPFRARRVANLWYAGRYMVTAIEEFLGKAANLCEGWQGFIVDQRTGVAIAHADEPDDDVLYASQPPEFAGYAGKLQKMDMKWQFHV